MPIASPQRSNAPEMDAAQRAIANGDLAAAERICASALATAPDDGRAWTLLTETALLRRRADAAMVCAEQAVALSPDDPIAHILRAKCLFFLGEAAQVFHAADAASHIVGSAPQALDALGGIFGLLGLHDRAHELFRRAVAARPGEPQYLFNLAATERMTGRLDDAEDHCDAAIALNRHYALAHYLRSDVRIQTPDRNHIADMERLVRDGRLAPPNEIMLRFALGKEYEDLDLPRHAFDHVEAGCHLQRRSMAYDVAVGTAEIDRIIRTQTRAWLAAARPGFAAAAPVFVVGLPRTGTTLVERIIGSHSAIRSVGEIGAFVTELHRFLKAAPNRLDPEDIGRRYVNAVTAFRVPQDVRFIDKTLQNYLYCGLIHSALPAAKIILVQRRALDACWAMYKAHFQGMFPFTYHQTDLAEYYMAFRRLSRHWKATLPPEVFLQINYEDIVTDQAAASRRLIAFAGLPWEDEVLQFHLSSAPSATASAVQVRCPVYSSSMGKWQCHAERLSPLRECLARELPRDDLA